MPRALRPSVGIAGSLATSVCAALALGCAGPDALALEVTFADAAVRDATVAVELTVRADACETGELLWQRVVRSGEQPSDRPPRLSRGRAYCIEAIARDDACEITGRATHASGDAPTGLVTLELAPPNEGEPAGGCEGATCVAGACVERCDDEGAACVAEGVPGVCRAGACCTGCWDGERCVRGTPAAELSTGEYFTCIRSVDGRVACWGSNGQGELGDGTRGGSTGPTWRADPRWIDVPVGTRFVAIETGVATAYAIDSEGRLWAWGWNERGQLGVGDAAVGVNALSPVLVPHPLGNAWERVVAVAAHVDGVGDPDLHVCAFSRGELWCWGANEEGQVDPSQPASARDAIVASPRRVEGLFSDVAVSQRATCVVRAGGVACWGDNARGELGAGDRDPRSGIVPVTLPEAALPVVEIAAGTTGFCIRGGTDGDRVFCWGAGDDPSLPTAPAADVRGVDEASALAPIGGSSEARRLSLGRTHGGALTDGASIVWGSNGSGRLALGAGAGAGPFPPTEARSIPGAPTVARELAVGLQHTCLRLSDGSLACAGSNQFGQLGVPVAQPSYPEWQRHCPCVGCER